MGDLLGNLVFVVVAILAWIVKEAVERKESKEAGQQRPQRRPGSSPGEDPGGSEADVVYGRRKIPDSITAPPAPLSSEPATGVEASSGGPKAMAGGRMGHLIPRDLGTRFESSRVPDTGRRASHRQRTAAWVRLGVPRGMVRRDAVRAGVLWSEVLAVPRALQGPHRSPVQKRRR